MNHFAITLNSPKLGELLLGRIDSNVLPRATLWMFRPGVQPEDGQPWRSIKRQRVLGWSRSIKAGQSFRFDTSRLKKPGVYTLVAHVPKEPGSVGGDYEQAVRFEVRP